MIIVVDENRSGTEILMPGNQTKFNYQKMENVITYSKVLSCLKDFFQLVNILRLICRGTKTMFLES
jgi:hypothetical protein